MTKVMTPQGIIRDTDDLFYYDPKPYSDEEECQYFYNEGNKPEDIANRTMRKRYEKWLKKYGLVATGEILTEEQISEVIAKLNAQDWASK
jgi:hypothetical protein